MTLKLESFTEEEALRTLMVGLMQQHASISAKIDEVNGELRGTAVKQVLSTASKAPSKKSPGTKRKKHAMSAAGRAAIVAAQKARWAKVKKAAKKK